MSQVAISVLFVLLEKDFLEEYIDGWVNESKKDKQLSATENKKYLSDKTIEGLHITGRDLWAKRFHNWVLAPEI